VPADDERFQVRLADGAECVARPAQPADAIVVDGYDGSAQVAELSTPQFYAACRQRLAPGGVLVVNLWGSDRRFNAFLQRIESAFPAATLCLPAEKPGNVIVFGFRDAPSAARWDALALKAGVLEARYGLEFGRFVRGLRKMNRSDGERLFMGPALVE
jgi:spermidine synthase